MVTSIYPDSDPPRNMSLTFNSTVGLVLPPFAGIRLISPTLALILSEEKKHNIEHKKCILIGIRTLELPWTETLVSQARPPGRSGHIDIESDGTCL